MAVAPPSPPMSPSLAQGDRLGREGLSAAPILSLTVWRANGYLRTSMKGKLY
ncbi:hypothetical protein E2C01_057946 [Portunus trituberculatus]|uniref:Uncharacterized protein n=1 Tax=Portunus trituberculatus TaxID=210409 RepID=A0A5B7GUV9_PORTR|nr:hypothetical protein [Portunus trituberculatus]